ncbi:hypothetical protein DMN91_002765 [Ooceraea biroi]|uniref:Uncharacterized protein n=1 Tax=Ooceraea biroi TaxID=2015173 RepID=A0A3L8DWD6_OOCBI|nr:hypothetical protein DMN91_002765 [Ooceraea biroi]
MSVLQPHLSGFRKIDNRFHRATTQEMNNIRFPENTGIQKYRNVHGTTKLHTVDINLSGAHCARGVRKRIMGLVYSPIHNGFGILAALSTSVRTVAVWINGARKNEIPFCAAR